MDLTPSEGFLHGQKELQLQASKHSVISIRWLSQSIWQIHPWSLLQQMGTELRERWITKHQTDFHHPKPVTSNTRNVQLEYLKSSWCIIIISVDTGNWCATINSIFSFNKPDLIYIVLLAAVAKHKRNSIPFFWCARGAPWGRTHTALKYLFSCFSSCLFMGSCTLTSYQSELLKILQSSVTAPEHQLRFSSTLILLQQAKTVTFTTLDFFHWILSVARKHARHSTGTVIWRQ